MAQSGDHDKRKRPSLGELVEQQPATRRVRMQTGTHTSQLDYARRFSQAAQRGSRSPSQRPAVLSVADGKLQVRAPSTRAVRAGLPAALLDELGQCLEVDRQELATTLQIDDGSPAAPTTGQRLPTDASARVAALLEVLAEVSMGHAGDLQAIIAFMTTARDPDGQSPLQRCASLAGARALLAELARQR